MKANGIHAGQLLPLNIAELQIAGYAHVNAIEPCPPIATGDGSVVTARFVTRQVDIIACVEILGADGVTEVLEGTTIHPIWSLDRNDWVELGELEQAEQLLGQAGPALVLTHAILQRSLSVYNIEVHGEHVYEVGEVGVTVHNAYPGELGSAVARGMKTIPGPNMADDAVEIAAKLGQPLTRQQIREVIHLAKNKMNIGAAQDLVLDLSGGMWDSRTGEFIGKLWDAL